MGDPSFWQTWFFISENASTVPDTLVEFDVGGGCQVVLDVQGRYGSYELGIRTPPSVTVVGVGWDDQARWHPYAFRWTELDLVCRAISVIDVSLPHPGPVLALLCRFASVQDDDKVERIAADLGTAFDSLRPVAWKGYWPAVDDWFARHDFRGQAISWERNAVGNLYATQRDDADMPFYSLAENQRMIRRVFRTTPGTRC